MISYIQIQGGPCGPGTVSVDTELRSTSTHYIVYFILIQGPLTANNNDQELTALRAEVERLEIASQESLLAQQSKHNGELADIRGQFDESERRIRAYEMDVQALREKLDKARLDSLQESEETMNEMRNVYEREKLMLMEENKKLQVGARCWTLNYIFGFSVKSEFLCTRQHHS